MTRTFLVAVDLNEAEDVSYVADEISDILINEGIAVTSVRPWGDTPQSVMPEYPEIPGL